MVRLVIGNTIYYSDPETGLTWVGTVRDAMPLLSAHPDWKLVAV